MLNECSFIGRLTRDPEVRYTQDNLPIASFSLAIERDGRNKRGQYETDFIDFFAAGKTAELISKYCSKGQQIGVHGRLQSQKWKTKTGETRIDKEVAVRSFFLLGAKKTETAQVNVEESKSVPDVPVDFVDITEDTEMLPF